MKEMNEYKAEIFSRMEKGIKERKRKRRRILTYGTPLCLCLVMLVCFSVWQSGFFNQPTDDIGTGNGEESHYTGDLTIEEEKDGQYDNENDGVWNHLTDDAIQNTKPGTQGNSSEKFSDVNVNKISSTVKGAKKYFDPAIYTERTLSDNEAIKYLGLDFSSLNIGAKYQGISMKNIITDKAENIVYDTFAISFDNNITILTSKIGLPYDCLYVLETKNESVFATVNNDSVSQTTAIIGTDNNGFYYADFSVSNINYRVTIENCSNEAKFAEIVNSVIDFSIK